MKPKGAATQEKDLLRLWIKTKFAQFYRQDPYLKHLQVDIALSPLYDALSKSRTVGGLTELLRSAGHTKAARLSRKGDGVSFFEYPPLGFQVESLVTLWPSICRLYADQKLLEGGNRFGHRPNLTSDYSRLSAHSTIVERDILINCPLKISFQEEYPAFKNQAVKLAQQILTESTSKNLNVLVIQSDIEKFFHKLRIPVIARYLRDNHPALFGIVEPFLKRIDDEFRFPSLPIGWCLSGVFADLISVEFHRKFEGSLHRELQKRIENTDVLQYLKNILSPEEIQQEAPKKLARLLRTAGLRYRSAVNYVDDFIFILEFNVSEQFKDKKLVKLFERFVSHLVIEIAEEQINSVFAEPLGLHLYRPDDEKGKHFSFDRSNIDTLSSNFFSIANNTPSDPEEPNLWTRLDEFLLPADNDLTLNERTQFFSHLANLRHKILEGERLEKLELEDIFQKILLKMKGPEAKYIASVIRLLEVLIISDKTRLSFGLGALLKIRQEFERSKKPLELWLRFFSGYFRIYSKLSFHSDFKFFDDFDVFSTFWKQNGGTEDDADLLEALRVTFGLRKILATQRAGAGWLEIMERRRQGHRDAGVFTPPFLALSCLPGANRIRVFVNAASDAMSLGAFIRQAANQAAVGPDLYLGIGRRLRQKIGVEAAIQFYNASAYSVVPRWGEHDTERFLAGLAVASSAQYQTIVRRLLKSARLQYRNIGDSYQERIQHACATLIEKGTERIPNIPKSFGSGDPSIFRSVLFYLGCLEANGEEDLLRGYLASLAPIDCLRDYSFVLRPTTMRKSGLAFSRLASDIGRLRIQSFRREMTRGLAEKVLVYEKKRYQPRGGAVEAFRAAGVCFVDINELRGEFRERSESLLLTLCPISLDVERDFNTSAGLVFSPGVSERLDLKIESAINEARRRGADVIVFPELCLPRRYLRRYLEMCGRSGLLLIAGLEYVVERSDKCRNATVISFPVLEKDNPRGRPFVAFEQDKHFPAAKEKEWLSGAGRYTYQPGQNLFIFKSRRFSSFSVLTCSDFLSLRLRLKLQERVQTVFVPAQNDDMTTYNHIAESSIRDLHCFAVVCNNQELGGSFVFAPYYKKNRRVVFNKEGSTLPEFLTMKWNPRAVKQSQLADSQTPFRPKDTKKENARLAEMKQTPPDWGY